MFKIKWLIACWMVFVAVFISLPAIRPVIPVSAAQSSNPVSLTQLQKHDQLPGFSTQPNLRFDRLSTTDGLSYSFTTSILQDRQGFMWFGTRYGLNQFDGFNFSIHLMGSSGDVLFANYIRNLYEDHNGDLWISNLFDLVRRDQETGEFVHYKPDAANPKSLWPGQIYPIAEDAAGNLWIGTTSGLNRYEPSTDTFTHYLTDVSVLSFLVDQQGGIWLGTGDQGLWHYALGSPGQQEPEIFKHDPSDPNSLSDNMVWNVYEDQQGILWVGTYSSGLNRLDPATGKFTRFQHNPQDPQSLSDDKVRSILEDSRGRLWIGTDNGLNLFDRTTGRFFQYHYDPGDPHSLSSNAVWDIYEDRSGLLWIATLGGISRLNETASCFTHYQQGMVLGQLDLAGGARSVSVLEPRNPPGLSGDAVSSVYQDRQGIVWIGISTISTGKLNRLDRSTGSVTVYQNDPNDPTSLSYGPVYTLYGDRAGTLWIGTLDGLNRFNPQTGSFEAEETFRGRRVTSIVEDQQGALWVGHWGGLWRREPGASDFTLVSLGRDWMSTDRVHTVYPDRVGAVWVSVENGGLFRLDPATGGGSKPTVIHFPQNASDPKSPGLGTVMSFYEDSQGTLWMSSAEDGLVRYDRDTQTFTHYLPDIGPSRYVNCIQGDAQGFLWMGTSLGLARFDPDSETFSYFDARDGLMIGESSACFKNQQGEMFFGSRLGLNTFFPDQIRDNLNPPVVAITALNLKNQPLRTDLLPYEQIKLSYQENYLSFDFAALDYNAPAKNQYAYKMEGLDADWIEAGTRRHADYPDLKPGTYTFRVKASNNSGVWNEQGAAVQITIVPPFWQTWWFIGLLGVALSGAVAGGVRLRLRDVEARSRELEAQVASRTAELVSSVAQLSALQETAKAVTSTLELDKLLNLIIQQATTLLHADGGFVNIVDWEKRVDEVVAIAGLAPQVIGVRTPLEGSLSGWVTLHNQATISNQIPEDDRVAQSARSWIKEEHIQSAVAVPLIVKEQVKGTLLVIGRKEGKGSFAQSDLDLLVAFANQAAIAIENASLYKQSRESAIVEEHRRQELEALLSADERMGRYLHQDQVLQALVDVAVDTLRADKSSVFLWDEKREKLVSRVVRGFTPEAISKIQFTKGQGIAAHAAETGMPEIIEDSLTDPRRHQEDPKNVQFAIEEDIRSFIFFPIRIGEEVVGVFNVSYQRPHAIGTEEQRLFGALVQRATLQIENARLYEGSQKLAVLEERSRLARELHDAVTQTLFSASLVAEALPATWEKDLQEGRGLLQELRGLSRGALAEMRSLLLELRPAALMETRLGDLLRQLGEAASGRAGIPVNVQVEGQAELPPDVQIVFYRIAQEALNNIVKHARARQVTMRLDFGGSTPDRLKVTLMVRDDGRGFDPAQIPHNRLGLGIMQERAQAVGASLAIESQPGHGTAITILWEQAGKEEAK